MPAMSQPQTPQQRFHLAVRDGDVKAYLQALNDGANPQARPPGMDEDWIVTACQGATLHTVDVPGQGRRQTPNGNHAAIVEHLVRHVGLGPSPDHPGLLIAVSKGHLDLAQTLVRLGFDARAFDDRALDLATENDRKDRTTQPTPSGHHREVVRFLLNQGCSLDHGKGDARRYLTESFQHEAKVKGVLRLDLPALDTVRRAAEAFGVTLNANALLSQLLMQRRDSMFSPRHVVAARGDAPDVDTLLVEMFDALVERGGWINAQGQVGCGTNGSFVLFATKNGHIALLDRMVALGADPRMDNDKPLLNAAMANQRAMVNHLIEQHGASLDGCNGQVRVQLVQALMESWEPAARAANLPALQADAAQAEAWGVALPMATAFHAITLNLNEQASACEAWMADRVGPEMWEEALRNQVAMGRTDRAQRWFDRLTADGQTLTPDLEAALFTLAGRKNQQGSLTWLIAQGLDLVTYGPCALEELDTPTSNVQATHQWLENQIEQEQLRREIAATAPPPLEAGPRRRL